MDANIIFLFYYLKIFFQIHFILFYRETFHDLKDLIHCIFDSISVPNLFQQPQSLLLNAITRSPSSVVTIIVDYLLNHLSDVKAFLSVSNTEVTLALANRIIESACAESVANVCIWISFNLNDLFLI